MLLKGNIMNKATYLGCKFGSSMLKDLCIPNLPNIPTSYENHLIEKRLLKGSSGPYGCLNHVNAITQCNLEVVPYTLANIAREE